MATSFGFLIYPGVEELDFQGPWEIVGIWHKYAGGPKPLLLARTLDPIVCAHGMRVLPDQTLAAAGELSQLLIPGGFGAFEEMKMAPSTGFAQSSLDAGATVMTVCSGAFIALAAGLLVGRKATTNWKAIEALRLRGVEVVEERYVHDGPIWSSAGVSAGIDMLLDYISVTCGEDAASIVQLNAEYFPSSRLYGNARSAQRVPGYIERF